LEKRLLIALLLSTVVLFGWHVLFPGKPAPPQPEPTAGAPIEASQTSPSPNGASVAEAPAKPQQPIVGTQIGESDPRELTLTIGTPGERGSYLARFTNKGAKLAELRLGNFYDLVGLSAAEKLDNTHWTELLTTADVGAPSTGSLVLRSDVSSKDLEREPLDVALWRMRELTPAEGGPGVEFDLAQGSGVRFVKRVRFEPNSYRIHVELGIENQALDLSRTAGFLFTPAEVVPQESGDKFYVEPQAIAAGRTAEDQRQSDFRPPTAQSVPRDDSGKAAGGSFDVPEEALSFAGVHNKYFAVLMRGADANSAATIRSARWKRLRDETWARANPDKATAAWHFMSTEVVLQLQVPPRGETKLSEFVVYAGPKDRAEIQGDFADHEQLVVKDQGFFHSVAHVLLAVLGFFSGLVGNWGVSIILLTLSVRALLFPINRRSQTAMARFAKKMKRLQPQIDELKKRHADEPDKQRKAQAEIMQKEGMVPPLGGCLPVFIQLPVFIGLFSALRTSFDLRQAPFFLWIKDLSKPDHLLALHWDTHLPLIGTVDYLNLLPILMVVLWLWQQMTMPKPTDEQAARMQKMMMFMPVVMGFFLYNYAAGLSVYMCTQSLLGIVEQTVIKKIWPIDDTEQPKKSDGFLARMQKRAVEMQKLQDQRRRGSGRAAAGARKKR
jgi:YidC/Oxa1 family membrane protein insertase